MPSASLCRHQSYTQYASIHADETLKYIKEEKEENEEKGQVWYTPVISTFGKWSKGRSQICIEFEANIGYNENMSQTRLKASKELDRPMKGNTSNEILI